MCKMAETALDLSKPSADIYVKPDPDSGPSSPVTSEESSSQGTSSSNVKSDELSSSDKTIHRPFKMYPVDQFASVGLSNPISPLSPVPSTATMSSVFDTAIPTFPLTPLTSHLLQRKRRAESRSDSKDSKKSNPVPEDKKDESYWERRRKNNEAAKRSRDSRREKEEEIAMRAAFLEQENLKLRAQVAILKNETAKLHYMLYNRL